MMVGIFSRLRKAGMPLSIKNYLDGLQALELYKEPFSSLEGVKPISRDGMSEMASYKSSLYQSMDREELVWLCQALWARTAEEEKLVREVVTSSSAAPKAVDTLRMYELLEELEENTLSDFIERPIPTTEEINQQKKEEEKQGKKDASIPNRRPYSDQFSIKAEGENIDDEENIDAEIDEDGQSEVPDLASLDIPGKNNFSMQQEPLMSPLWLTSMWRRLLKPVKTIDYRSIDAIETAKAAARTGCILEPKYVTRYTNTARLLVMLDVGMHMAPWYDFQKNLRDTLKDSSSRLKQAEIVYFIGAPGKKVFLKENLKKPIRLDNLLKEFHNSPLLIFGEGGSIGQPRRDYNDRVEKFFLHIQNAGVKPIVWINPMPEERWEQFANLSDKYAHTHTLPFNTESLLAAVDILRGVHS
jgi:hypothetical protein